MARVRIQKQSQTAGVGADQVARGRIREQHAISIARPAKSVRSIAESLKERLAGCS